MITATSVGSGGLGRLGNTMFTIAGVIGIAEKSGQPFAFPEWKIVDNERFGQPVDHMNDYMVNPLPLLPDGLPLQDYGYFWGYRDIVLPSGSWDINAHMQSPKFFSHCIDKVRECFRFKNEPEQTDHVAVHYRAGDYQDDENAYHPRCSKEYYHEAMKQFPVGTKFMLFSDDLQAAHDRLGLTGEVNKDASNSSIKEFAIMKRCRHFITANSSYSLMAAILGEAPDKKIICPARWFGPSVGLETKDIYPEGAVVI